MRTLLWLSVGLPLVGAVAVRTFPRRSSALTVAIAVGSVVPALGLLIGAVRGERAASDLAWLPTAGLNVGLRLDHLSAVMSATVAGIGLVVLVYATGYFATDGRRASALAGLLAFLAAMQGLVLADGYLALLVFWELVGAASARLIAYTREDPAAGPGAVRAFLTTRGADVGFYIALLALFSATGSVAFGQGRPAGTLGALVGLGLVLAAIGKSAQAPLQTWLAGAMAGPTPVSALLHSATMVAAGVYLLVRSQTLLVGWPLHIAGWVGATTAVATAMIALAQRDLKRVLAGSTASQLGLMFVAAAAGGPAVAIFHLVMHAIGKAGLFLAAGVFQHDRDSVALEDLRGVGRDDPHAFAGFVVCALSIAGVPPLAAFWSKDHVVAVSQHRTMWFTLVLLSAAGSSAYLLRPAVILWDRAGGGAGIRRPGRRPMLVGLGVLTAGSLVAGVLGGPLAGILYDGSLPVSSLGLALSLTAIAAGAGAVLIPLRAPPAVIAAARDQLYAKRLQAWLVQRPVLGASRVLAAIEDRWVDRAVTGVGRAGLSAARGAERLERHGIDASVDGLARIVGRSGAESRRLQSGRLFEYLRDAALGAVAVAALVALSALT